MRVAIVGSRSGVSEVAVRSFVERLYGKYPNALIVSGGAKGVDSWAVDEAEHLGLATLVFPAEWDRFGRSAGFRRNRTIVDNADVVVAFTTGSRGTAHTIDLARSAGKQVVVYGPRGEETPRAHQNRRTAELERAAYERSAT